MKSIVLICALLFFNLCQAQTIEKFSIDSGGDSASNGNIEVLYTIGEVNVAGNGLSFTYTENLDDWSNPAFNTTFRFVLTVEEVIPAPAAPALLALAALGAMRRRRR